MEEESQGREEKESNWSREGGEQGTPLSSQGRAEKKRKFSTESSAWTGANHFSWNKETKKQTQ